MLRPQASDCPAVLTMVFPSIVRWLPDTMK